MPKIEATEEQEFDVVEKEQNEDVDTNNDADIDSAESAAREQGWVPQEEWEGEPDKWVDAKQFIFRGELMDRIRRESKSNNKLSKEVDNLKKALKEMGALNKKIAQKEYERAVNDLKRRKAAAMEEQDYDEVVDLDEKLRQTEDLNPKNIKDEESETEDNVKQELPPEVEAWIDRNQWYVESVRKRGVVDGIAMEYKEEYPNATPAEVIKYVDKELRKEHPDWVGFKKAAHDPVSSTNKRGKSTQRTQKYSERHLNEDQRSFAREFVRSGAFENVQEYVNSLAEIGELDIQKGDK